MIEGGGGGGGNDDDDNEDDEDDDVDVDDSATRSQRLTTQRRRRFLKRVTRAAGDSVSRRRSVRKCETYASVYVCVRARVCAWSRLPVSYRVYAEIPYGDSDIDRIGREGIERAEEENRRGSRTLVSR